MRLHFSETDMLTGADNEARIIPHIEPTDTPPPMNPAAAGEKIRGFHFGRYRVRHLKSRQPEGWGHDEGDSVSRTLISLDFVYEGDRRSAIRIIVGRHSFWLFN